MSQEGATIEWSSHNSVPQYGYVDQLELPLGLLQQDSGATIGAIGTGTFGWNTINTSFRGVTFDAATTTGQTFRLNHTFPGYLHVGNPHIAVLVEARLRDKTGSATAQPTLNLTAQAFWNSAGVDTSAQTLASAATFGQLNSTSTVLGATDYTDSQTEGFAWYIADITVAMSAAQRLALKTNLEGNSKPLGMQFVIAPSATVGANLAIDVKSIVLQYRRHQGLRRITDRP